MFLGALGGPADAIKTEIDYFVAVVLVIYSVLLANHLVTSALYRLPENISGPKKDFTYTICIIEMLLFYNFEATNVKKLYKITKDTGLIAHFEKE